MMNRKAVGGVQDMPVAPPSPKAPTANGTGEAKVIWITDPTTLVGPREEEARRKGPESKLLYAVSALLTIMVLWGIFKEAHLFVPRILPGSKALVQDAGMVDADAFQADPVDVDVGGRREAKHLLEIEPQAFVRKQPHKFGYPRRTGEHIMRFPRGGRKNLLGHLST